MRHLRQKKKKKPPAVTKCCNVKTQNDPRGPKSDPKMAPNDLKWAKNDPKWPKKKDSEFLSNSAIKTKNSEILSKLRNSELCRASALDFRFPQQKLSRNDHA